MADNLPIILARAHYRDLRTASYQLAVLPWGATEAHNLHLSYGTDIIESERIAADAAEIAAAKGAKLIVLPSIPFGVNPMQLDIPLTINMNPSTQLAIVRDILTSLEGYGIPKLVILNSHGGNDFKSLIRERCGLEFDGISELPLENAIRARCGRHCTCSASAPRRLRRTRRAGCSFGARMRQHASTRFSVVGMVPAMKGTSRFRFLWSTCRTNSCSAICFTAPKSMT